jgi:hypothetical protein
MLQIATLPEVKNGDSQRKKAIYFTISEYDITDVIDIKFN